MPRVRRLAAGGSAGQSPAPNPLPPRERAPPPGLPSHSLLVLVRQGGGPWGRATAGSYGPGKGQSAAVTSGLKGKYDPSSPVRRGAELAAEPCPAPPRLLPRPALFPAPPSAPPSAPPRLCPAPPSSPPPAGLDTSLPAVSVRLFRFLTSEAP